ncbi:Rap1-interacting factor 1 N terminal-domain-containing protein [Lineolata rhizophorae]|uniref:Rap1-interacting factor 1 N terminal-domain-containing protein n=1 Tax=Lineolata rhizophorae TaxID=578093 RepID=A0A6A6NPV7_9PEZI|nr:Rap1-interacting factor 1 N terminal-domain-containing protein [Lineolata rhizophorae]
MPALRKGSRTRSATAAKSGAMSPSVAASPLRDVDANAHSAVIDPATGIDHDTVETIDGAIHFLSGAFESTHLDLPSLSARACTGTPPRCRQRPMPKYLKLNPASKRPCPLDEAVELSSSSPIRRASPPGPTAAALDEAIDIPSSSDAPSAGDEAVGADPVDPPSSPPVVRPDTPPPAPSPAKRRRVDFNPSDDFISPPTSPFLARKPDRKPLPSAHTLKSILKRPCPLPESPSDPMSASLTQAPEAGDFVAFPDTLEWAVQQLSTGDRLACRDAYTTLIKTVKAYGNTPEIAPMKVKMALFMVFFRRDLVLPTSGEHSVNKFLVVNAIRLLDLCMDWPILAEAVDDGDFCTFVLDQAIAFLSNAIGAHVKHEVGIYLHILSHINFKICSLPQIRISRLFDCLDKVKSHVQFAAILEWRLLVYGHMLSQLRQLMINWMPRWLPTVFDAMFHDHPQVRETAIEIGVTAGATVGDSSLACRKLMNFLTTKEAKEHVKDWTQQDKKQKENKEEYDRPYIDRLLARLRNMFESNGGVDSEYVPQIGGVIILFLQTQRARLESWPYLRPWLSVTVQHAMNFGRLQTKLRAYKAWQQLIYVVRPDLTTSEPIRRMLGQPFAVLGAKDEKKGLSRPAKVGLWDAFCALLYCSMLPGAPPALLDVSWEAYGGPILPLIADDSQQGVLRTCRILTAQLGGRKNTTWDLRRVLSDNEPVRPEELARLNPQWVRSRIDKLLPLVSVCLDRAPWNTNGTAQLATPEPVWCNLMHSVALAGAQEVLVSSEFTTAITHIMNYLHDVGCRHATSLNTDSLPMWIQRFKLLCSTVVEHLGPSGHMNNELLIMLQNGAFEPVSSHRAAANGDRVTPMAVLDRWIHPIAGGAPKSGKAVSLPEKTGLADPAAPLLGLAGTAAAAEHDTSEIETQTALHEEVDTHIPDQEDDAPDVEPHAALEDDPEAQVPELEDEAPAIEPQATSHDENDVNEHMSDHEDDTHNCACCRYDPNDEEIFVPPSERTAAAATPAPAPARVAFERRAVAIDEEVHLQLQSEMAAASGRLPLATRVEDDGDVEDAAADDEPPTTDEDVEMQDAADESLGVTDDSEAAAIEEGAVARTGPAEPAEPVLPPPHRKRPQPMAATPRPHSSSAVPPADGARTAGIVARLQAMRAELAGLRGLTRDEVAGVNEALFELTGELYVARRAPEEGE